MVNQNQITLSLKVKKSVQVIARAHDLDQGGQSRGQHNWVHGFPEPVKSFITFITLSQILCG